MFTNVRQLWFRRATHNLQRIGRKRAASFKPLVEALEHRLAPALAFLTPPQTLTAGQPSGIMTVQLQDAMGHPIAAGPGGVTLALSSISSGGTFLNTNDDPLASPSITIAEGFKTANFEYRDDNPGTPTITVSASGFSAIMQQETVTATSSQIHVTTLTDAGDGSLRQAIIAANTAPGSTIVFDAGVTGTLDLLTALPVLSATMNILGPGANLVTIERSATAATDFGIFNIHNGATVLLSDLTLANATSAGIANNGVLTVRRLVVQGNHASDPSLPPFGAPGGILNFFGTLSVINSTIADNTTVNSHVAAGIDTENGSVLIINSTISGNVANHTNSPGGIGVYGGTLLIENSTVTANVTNEDRPTNISGGGIDSYGGGDSVTIYNTIVAGNTGSVNNPSDVSGRFTSRGYNLIGSAESHSSGFVSSDVVGTVATPIDARLDALQNNGGPTPTRALLAGSPALNAADSSNAPATDQRGVARTGGVNIGAYQASASAFVVTATAPITAGTAFDLGVKAVDTFGQTAIGYLGTAHLTSSDGQAVLHSDYTFTSSDAGVTTLGNGVTLFTAGNQTVTASDTTAGSITGNVSVSVSAAAAHHLLFSQQPTDTPAGQTISQVVVEVVDQYGNVVTNYSGMVTLAIGTNPSGGTLNGTLTVTVVNGMATFSDLSIDLAGTGYTLHATIGGGLPDIDSDLFNIT